MQETSAADWHHQASNQFKKLHYERASVSLFGPVQANENPVLCMAKSVWGAAAGE